MLPLFGACLGASLALFLAAALPFGGVLSLFAPLPVAYCYFKAREPGVAVALAGTLLVSLPAAGAESRLVALLFLELAVVGLIVGELLRRQRGPGAALLFGVAAMLAVSTGLFLAYASVEGKAPAFLAAAYVSQTMAEARSNMAALGYGPPEVIEASLRGLADLLPALLTLTAGLVIGLNLAAARKALRVSGEELAPWPVFRLWQAPEPLVWVLVAAGVLLILPVGQGRLVGLNTLAVLAVIYFIQGLSVVAFHLERLHVKRPLRLVIYAVLGLQQFLSLAVAVVGLFDLWIDFRRLRQAAVEEAES